MTASTRRRPGVTACLAAMLACGGGWSVRAQSQDEHLRRLTLEQLLNVEITIVSRTPEPAERTPAAVTVLTHEDIRRSGVTTLAEALRLVPGVHVAQIDANKWAIGIRGFTDRLSRSMLVMIDGRAVYSPLFAGTYWEMQDTLLEDVERIEVVRGPGGTLWGANAVNGIVNVVTRSARATRGALVVAGGGSQERGFLGVRFGGGSERAAYRVYAKLFDRAPGYHANARDFDRWSAGQAGVRSDWDLGRDRELTVQGDVYTGTAGQRLIVTTYTPPFTSDIEDRAALAGANLLARWRATTRKGSQISLQAYYDRTHRTEASFEDSRHTVDLDYQQGQALGAQHRLVWGLGYRANADATRSRPIREFLPAARTDHILSAFAQDHFTLVPGRLDLVGGVKIEHNDYSGVEVQPSARVLWTPHAHHTAVLSATRAVRTPSRVEVDYRTGSLLSAAPPLFLRLEPNEGFQSETLVAYEAGYRTRAAARLFVTLSAFFNHHREVLSTTTLPTFAEALPPPAHLILPVQFTNALHGNSHGLEATAELRLAEWWRLTGSYSGLRIQLSEDPGEVDVSQERRAEGGSPRHQVQLHASLDLPARLTFDWHLRHVSSLPALLVSAYATADIRLAWKATERMELSIVGRNLHQAHHLEFVGGAAGNVEVPRSAYGQMAWRLGGGAVKGRNDEE